MSIPTYQAFATFEADPDYVFEDVVHSDTQSSFVYFVPVYRGIPAGQTVEDAVDDGYRYLYLGQTYGNFYMLRDNFANRLANYQLSADYKKLKAGKEDLFPVWTSKGGLTPIPRTFVVTLNQNETLASWSARQKQNWSKIIQSTGDAVRPAPYNVLSRFIQPAAFPNFELVFTPSDDEAMLSKAALTTTVTSVMALDGSPKYPFRILTWQQAKADPNLTLLSSNYFGFYHTWINPVIYTQVCNNVGTANLQREWPTNEAAATAIDTLLGLNSEPGDGNQTSSLISSHKMSAARGMRATVPSQKSVMGDKSATDVAVKLWAAATLAPAKRPADSEWLHRSAFHYGGVGGGAVLNSSQTRANLVFGSGEANTDMIRGENAVTDIVNLCKDSKGGTLMTTNIITGSVDRRNANGSFTATPIPAWVATKRTADPKSLWWLCLKLRYRFDLKYDDLNLNVTSSTDYDPFSRYIPFRIEARLDEAILSDYIKQATIDSGLAAKKQKTNAAPATAPTTQPVAGPSGAGPTISAFALPQTLSVGAVPAARPPLVAVASKGPSQSIFPPPKPTVPRNPLPLLAPTPSSVLGAPAPGSHMATRHLTVRAHSQWRSITSKPSAITVNGVVVRSPVARPHQPERPPSVKQVTSSPVLLSLAAVPQAAVAAAPAAAKQPGIADAILATVEPPPAGFTLEGQIDLFGLKTVQAQFYSWNGPLPPNVDPPLTGTPVYDKAVVTGDFKFSSVLPKLKGTAFDNITLRNVTFIHQNAFFDPSKALGWHIDADVLIDKGCGQLYDLLQTVLKVKEPTLHLHAGLGANQDWGKSLAISSFTLDGTFPGLQVPICKGFTMTSIGAELLGIRRLERLPDAHFVLDYGFGVFGSFNLDVPGSVTPLELDYNIRELGGFVQLNAVVKGDIWNEPLGIKGLRLWDVSFNADVGLSQPLQSYDFSVAATFQYKSTSAIFSGSYAAGKTFSISATISNFDLNSIFEIYESLTGEYLAPPDVDVKIGSATIAVASGSGLAIALQNVQVEGRVAANALLTIGPTGVGIRGDVTSTGGLTFGEVELKKAFVQIDLVKGATGSGVALGGEVAFQGLTFDALAHLYKGDTGAVQWTVLAAITTSNNALAISKLVPELKGTFLDLALTQVVFAAASQDDPQVASLLPVPYQLHQGIQICASLSPIAALDSVMRSSAPTPGLTLSAGWSKATGFALDIIMPSASVVHLGNGIVTDPFKLRIQVGAPPTLLLIAGVQVPVEPAGNSLDFQMSLGINAIGASASAQMHGWWINPLGLGQNVKIGPDVALSIEIIFAQFVATGTPSGFGIVGGLAIGKASASIAMAINENPSRELISGKVQALDVQDLVSFANTITGLSIPQPPNFLDFQNVELYICPAGTTIGTLVYPKGFSFQAAVKVFEKQATIACAVGSNSVTIKGSLDNFTLGPLSVQGVNDPHPTLDIEISPSKQHIDIDGQVIFFDSKAAISVQVDVMPKPAFSFITILKFTDLLLFNLNAQLVGAVSFGSLTQADFIFYALMEQHILQYVEDEIAAQFNAAKTASHAGFLKAQNDLSSAQATVDKRISDAQKALDAAQKSWETKRDQVTKDANSAIANYNAQIDALSKNVQVAQTNYNNAMQSAQNALQQANNNRASALADAKQKLEQAKKDAQAKIDSASRDVANAQAKMDREFGNAVSSIQSAQNKVDSLQNQINDVKGQIDHYNSLPWYDPRRAAVVGLGTELAGLYTAKGVADGVLTAAKAVVTSAGYVADQAGIRTAQAALSAAQAASPITISAAQGVLDGVDKSTNAAVTAAQKTVDVTKTGTQYVAFQGTQQALSAYKAANQAVYDNAVRALNTVTSLAEYAAFQAAQAGLATAKQAISSLDGLKQALAIAQQGEDFALKIGQWVAQHALSLVDIQKIELSGSLRGMIGQTGGVSKPFTAHVEYVLAGQGGKFDGQLDLRKTADFISAIFEKMWGEVKSLV